MGHLDEKSVSDNQHVFCPKRSCETQLVTTINGLAQSLGERGQVDIILLDFSKTSDKVPHQRLAHNLNYYGIKDTTLRWITDFHTDRTQQVLLERQKSSTVPVLSGVPQGTVLGPLLFLLYINDRLEMTTSDACLFAYDCLLNRPVTVKVDTDTIQRDLDALISWEED